MHQVPFFLSVPQVHPLMVFSGAGDGKLRTSSLPNGVIFSFIVSALSTISNQLVGHFDPFLLYFLCLWLPCTPPRQGTLILILFCFLLSGLSPLIYYGQSFEFHYTLVVLPLGDSSVNLEPVSLKFPTQCTHLVIITELIITDESTVKPWLLFCIAGGYAQSYAHTSKQWHSLHTPPPRKNSKGMYDHQKHKTTTLWTGMIKWKKKSL